jgi:hypothetical protein
MGKMRGLRKEIWELRFEEGDWGLGTGDWRLEIGDWRMEEAPWAPLFYW